jgi:osmotically inducible protein OsmC
MKRKASAVWRGGLKDGKGTISSDSGVLKETQDSFSTRFENGIGTNPEELIAAAHAGCFSMALSAELGKAGITPGPSTRRRRSRWIKPTRVGRSRNRTWT